MIRKDINKKMTLELSQIRSILSDFRKAKQKCLTICQQIHEDLPNKVHFDSVQRETVLKMELLDLPGLVQLKNTLVRTLTELFDLENDLHTKKQKYIAKKQFGNIVGGQNLVSRPMQKQNKANISLQQIDRKVIKITEEEELEREKTFNSFEQKQKKQAAQSRYNVPIYHAQEDNSQNKIDRISKYIASLKRNMKQHCNQSLGALNSEARQILLQQPIFTSMKEELQRFKMRQEELEQIVLNKVQQSVKNYMDSLEVIQETKDYKVVKIYKDNFNESSLMDTMHNVTGDSNKTKEYFKHKSSKLERTKLQEESLVSQEQVLIKGKEIEQLQMDLQKNEYNVEEVVSRISQTLENSQIRLRQLRNQRKKMLLDDEIWAQFEQI